MKRRLYSREAQRRLDGFYQAGRIILKKSKVPRNLGKRASRMCSAMAFDPSCSMSCMLGNDGMTSQFLKLKIVLQTSIDFLDLGLDG